MELQAGCVPMQDAICLLALSPFEELRQLEVGMQINRKIWISTSLALALYAAPIARPTPGVVLGVPAPRQAANQQIKNSGEAADIISQEMSSMGRLAQLSLM